MSSWVCTQREFRRLDRKGVRHAVLGASPPAPWTAYATTSYKKHGSLRAPINGNGRAVWLFETRKVDCSDRKLVQDWWQRLVDARLAGIPRPVIEDLQPSSACIRKVSAPVWMRFHDWAQPRHKSALYAFLAYLLPSEEEVQTWSTNAISTCVS